MTDVTESTAPEYDVQKKATLALYIGSLICMLYYECTWCWFALHNRGAISLRSWIWTSFAVIGPWWLGHSCLSYLREAVKNGKVDPVFCWKLSMEIGGSIFLAYLWLVPEVKRMTILGALK